MKPLRHLSLCLCLAFRLAAVAFAQSPGPSVATGEDWTFPYTVTPSPYSGYFKDPTQANPGNFIKHLKVHHSDANWALLNPGENQYDFSSITTILHDALVGNYLCVFRMQCGQYGASWDGQFIPQWVVNKYSLAGAHTFRTREAANGDPEILYAAPWHNLGTGGGVQGQFQKFIQALCAGTFDGYRFIEHPAMGSVFLHGCSRSRGEESSISGAGWDSAGGLAAAGASANACGYAGSAGTAVGNAVNAAWTARINYWHDTLQAQATLNYMYKVCFVGGGSWANTTYNSAAGLAMEDLARSKGMGLRGGFIEHYYYGNVAPPKAGQTYSNGYVVSDWTQALRDGRFWSDEIEENNIFQDPISGANIYYYSANGSAGVPGKVRDLVSRTLFFRAAQLGMNFLWPSPWTIRYACWNNPNESTTDCTPGGNTSLADASCADASNKARVPLWFTLVAGKGPATSPDAACWLRRATVRLLPGQDPAGAPWKNMERMLMQRDITGATTTEAEVLNMPRVDLKPDSDYQEAMARRTDYASGNRKIAFVIEPAFKASLSYPVQIKVTYRDTSSALANNWNVRVVKTGNVTQTLNNVATMNGDSQWKTATFTVQSSSAFVTSPTALGTTQDGGVDFVIEVPTANANLTVRYVRVVRTSEPGAALAGQWKLNETGGTTANDSSGNANHGTLTNFAASPPWASGGLDFDGVDDLINAGSGATLDNLPQLSLSAWIYADTLGEGANGRIISKGGAAGTFTGWRLLIQATNRVAFSVDYATGYLSRTTVDNAITLGAWNHVAVTWDGSGTAANAHIFINGTEAAYSTTTNAPAGESRANDSTYTLTIGNDSSGARTFDGVLRDVRVYNGIITTAQISALAQPAPIITTASLPSGRTTIGYGNQSLAASGGTTPYTWSLSAGALPAGLTLSTGGVISGTPTTAGTSNFTARVTDANGAFDDQPLAITINANSVPDITTTSLPGGTVGVAYNQPVASTGGDGALAWSVFSGALPAGLTLSNANSQNATISGTPTTAGTANFTLKLADVDNDSDTQALSISVVSSTPAAPSGLGLTVVSYNQINLAWTDNANNETGFRVERKTGASGAYAEIGTTGANVTTYSDTTCGAGTLYYYRVRAYNGSGNSAYCTEVSSTSAEITSGRQGHWKLDETTGTSATDSSGNNNTGTLTSGPTHVAGKIGNGVNFDGVDDLINCGSGASLDNLAAMTISGWFKANSLGETSNGRILSKGGAAGTFTGWRLLIQATNRIAFSVDYATNYMSQVTADNVITTGAGTWYHVIVTWNGGATPASTHIYVNGVEASYGTGLTGTGTRANDGTYNLTIGNDSSAAKTFDGAIDEVRVYNRVLSAAEIAAVYRAGL